MVISLCVRREREREMAFGEHGERHRGQRGGRLMWVTEWVSDSAPHSSINSACVIGGLGEQEFDSNKECFECRDCTGRNVGVKKEKQSDCSKMLEKGRKQNNVKIPYNSNRNTHHYNANCVIHICVGLSHLNIMSEQHRQATRGLVSFWQISSSTPSANESDFKAALILKKSALPVVETRH